MALDGLMFVNLLFYPIVDRIVSAKASLRPHIFDLVVMRVVFKGDVFEFIGYGHTKKWIVLCELHHDWF